MSLIEAGPSSALGHHHGHSAVSNISSWRCGCIWLLCCYFKNYKGESKFGEGDLEGARWIVEVSDGPVSDFIRVGMESNFDAIFVTEAFIHRQCSTLLNVISPKSMTVSDGLCGLPFSRTLAMMPTASIASYYKEATATLRRCVCWSSVWFMHCLHSDRLET
jgi:hypothetical protein